MFGWANERVNDNSFYTLENGIVTASILNTLIRNCNSVDMANYSVFVNINGAIQTSKQGVVLRPQYYVFKLYTHHMGEVLVDSEVISDRFEVNMPKDRRVFRDYYNEAAVEKGGRLRSDVESLVKRDIQYLDSVSTIDEKNKHISISLINKSLEDDINCTIEISNDIRIKNAQMHSIWSAGINDYNSEEIENIGIESAELATINKEININIPRHSINVLKLEY